MAHIENMKCARTTFKSQLTRCKTFLDGHTRDTIVELIEGKLKTLTEKFAEWERSSKTPLELDIENAEINTREGDTIEENYELVAVRMRRLIKEKNTPTMSSPSTQPTSPHNVYSTNFNMTLPEITLPTFDGRFETYRPFRDQFNARLPSHADKVIRLQYLQTCCKGETFQAIEALDITDMKYDAAWALLDKNLDIPRQALRRHCSHLLKIGKKNRENKSLIDLVNAVGQQLRSISGFGTAKEQLNGIICTSILDQQDEDLVFQWETLIEGKEMPEHEQLLDFLLKRGICAKNADAPKNTRHKNESSHNKDFARKNPYIKRQYYARSSPSETIRAQAFLTNSPMRSPVCSEEHRIYECSKFTDMDVETRKKLIFSHIHCLNYLVKAHGIKECKSNIYCKRGNKPEARHHSLPYYDKQSPTASASTTISRPLDSSRQDMFPTAIMNLLNKNHQPIHCLALIDTASTKNFIIHGMDAELGNKKLTCSIPVGALNELSTTVHHRI
ncbi:uncharacterized protein LOC135169785 [Diachasmimorpha longicaudata]|uniref:uncharacterized protein LOC135169785 n=1 Tax=Diachasmimorpha longicaudata TaxID=58733 RepID=UPI0030B8758F